MLEQRYEFDSLFDSHQHFFDKFRMEKQNIIEVFQEWKESEEDTIVKYLWAIFEKLLIEIVHQTSDVTRMHSLLSFVYKEMRNYKNKYEGEKANDLHKKHLFFLLKYYEHRFNPDASVTLIASHCCGYCGQLNGKQVTIEEALDEQYLPHEKCTNGIGCNCFYRPV